MQQGWVFRADHYEIPFWALPCDFDERIHQELRLLELHETPAENDPPATSTKTEALLHLRNLLGRKTPDQVIIWLVRKIEHAVSSCPVLRPVLTPESATHQEHGSPSD